MTNTVNNSGKHTSTWEKAQMSLEDEITRIRKYKDNPDKAPPNESCTCEWVILPLLWQAGYAHDEIVSRVLDATRGFPDYMILPGTSHTWYLEAKAWKEELQDAHVIQAMNYAHAKGRRWVVLSNGREWRLYDDHIQGVEAGQRLVAVAHLGDSCELLDLLTALSKQSVEASGLEKFAAKSRLSAILDAQLVRSDSEIIKSIGSTLKKLGLGVHNKDIVDYFHERNVITPQSPVTSTTIQSLSTESIAQPTSSSPLAPGGHKDLESLYALGNALRGGPSPTKLAFPDGSSVSVKSWRDVAIAIVTWLGDNGKLPRLPFCGRGRGKRCFLNTVPQHMSGKKMISANRLNLQNQTIYVETNWSASDCVQYLYALCRESSKDPSGFVVSL